MTSRAKTAVRRMAAQHFPSHDVIEAVVATEPPRLFADTPPPPTRTPVVDRPARAIPPMRRRIAMAATAIGVIGVGLASLLLPRSGGSSVYAWTAPMLTYQASIAQGSAMDALHTLADHAAGQPDPPGSGPYHYVHTSGWYLHTDTATDMTVLASGIAVVDRRQWIRADGAGRLVISEGGQPSRLSGDYQPGGLHADFLPSTDDAALRAILLGSDAGTRDAAAWFETIRNIWANQVVTPQLQSVLLDILAGRPGTTMDGTTTDRAGRAGIAVSATSASTAPGTPQMRYVLVLDPQTGMLLDYERVALTAGGLPIQAPATIGYTVWLAAGYTADTVATP
jgi:hypothetical protein